MIRGLIQLTISEIEVLRSDRQRREVDTSGLMESIKRIGLINPVIVERVDDNYRLIAGERRLSACKKLGWLTIPARLASELSIPERQIIELEENIKRQDLEWKDFCRAVLRIHTIHCNLDPSWTQEKTASDISLEPGTLSIILRVAEELADGKSLIQEAPNYRAAYNIISRKDSRKADDVFNDLLSGVSSPAVVPSESLADEAAPSFPSISDLSPSSFVLNSDFTQWIANYPGPPFNFIHCDFPYGIDLDKSDQASSATWGAYKDSKDTYWNLIHVLINNIDKILAPSSHLMFWLSSDYDIIYDTIKLFNALCPSLTFNPKPLIWHKTDGKGILPDPNRGPRHVYETAIFASRGDRLIAQAVADTYGFPKGASVHQSEKPQQMLQHFFRMFVDSGTSFFDPTCGSGSSLCAADSLGAKSVLGLEINPEWAKDANIRVNKGRLLK